ncbi:MULTISPECIES: hypothetical protein [Microbulbifer]|uniref:Uncharacterized protein n=1 Tax=Microbulbifer celer TaxID=435905 RepID=A0ABW3U9N5_9GAMM|nr:MULTISPECIES: hypothetical protein [Microbulbifer]UFN57232.1 hypothetical protein LPW13_16945 [Microbulbifer celer]
MNKFPSHTTRIWATLVLLLAFISAQPVLAEHIHIDDPSHKLCELSGNHVPAPAATEFTFTTPDLAPLYNHQQAPVAYDCQPERQSARGPPALLSHH